MFLLAALTLLAQVTLDTASILKSADTIDMDWFIQVTNDNACESKAALATEAPVKVTVATAAAFQSPDTMV